MARAERCGRSVIGRRPDATREGEKSYELRVKGRWIGVEWGDSIFCGGYDLDLTTPPIAPLRSPPSLGKRGALFQGSGVRRREAGVGGRPENTAHLVNHGLPSSLRRGKPERSDWWGGEARIVITTEIRIPPDHPYPRNSSPFTLHPSLSSPSPLVASGLRPMTERPQLPALADPSPNRRNSPLRLVIGEAPMPQTIQKTPSAVGW